MVTATLVLENNDPDAGGLALDPSVLAGAVYLTLTAYNRC